MSDPTKNDPPSGSGRLTTSPLATLARVVLILVMVAITSLPAGAALLPAPDTVTAKQQSTGDVAAMAAPSPISQALAAEASDTELPPGITQRDHAFAKGALLLAFALMVSVVLGLWIYLARAYAGRVRNIY